MTKNSIVRFLRNRDYQIIRELGQGACGKTVLLYDDVISSYFVCKKYSPSNESYRELLFDRFLQEIKLLYCLHHRNVVRVFNHYIYPDKYVGYILMEYIDGEDVESYLKKNPEQANEIFEQIIEGFSYLEENEILHRDIRPFNIMVDGKGTVKIIDLGFGKKIQESEDFDKSITLNWYGDTPPEFSNGIYDYQTEVYFVGNLFKAIVDENGIENFKHGNVLGSMCARPRTLRIPSFKEVKTKIQSNPVNDMQFEIDEISIYRTFAHELCQLVSKIEQDAKYNNDYNVVSMQLTSIYNGCILEEVVPSAWRISKAFIYGEYYFRSKYNFSVSTLKQFSFLMKAMPPEKKKVILSHLHGRLDQIPRYNKPDLDDEIPF